MDHLDESSVEELQDALDNVEGNKPTDRLFAAIAYKKESYKPSLTSGTAPAGERFTAG